MKGNTADLLIFLFSSKHVRSDTKISTTKSQDCYLSNDDSFLSGVYVVFNTRLRYFKLWFNIMGMKIVIIDNRISIIVVCIFYCLFNCLFRSNIFNI